MSSRQVVLGDIDIVFDERPSSIEGGPTREQVVNLERHPPFDGLVLASGWSNDQKRGHEGIVDGALLSRPFGPWRFIPIVDPLPFVSRPQECRFRDQRRRRGQSRVVNNDGHPLQSARRRQAKRLHVVGANDNLLVLDLRIDSRFAPVRFKPKSLDPILLPVAQRSRLQQDSTR